MSINEGTLFRKLVVLPKRGLGRLFECVLVLWAVLADPQVPTLAKVLAAVALGYLINPFDAVPDILPFGLVDDAALLVTTLGRISGVVSDDHRETARRKRRELGL